MKKLFTILVVLTILFSCKKKEEITSNSELLTANSWYYITSFTLNNKYTISQSKISFNQDTMKYLHTYYYSDNDFNNQKNGYSDVSISYKYTVTSDSLITNQLNTQIKYIAKYKYKIQSDSIILNFNNKSDYGILKDYNVMYSRKIIIKK